MKNIYLIILLNCSFIYNLEGRYSFKLMLSTFFRLYIFNRFIWRKVFLVHCDIICMRGSSWCIARTIDAFTILNKLTQDLLNIFFGHFSAIKKTFFMAIFKWHLILIKIICWLIYLNQWFLGKNFLFHLWTIYILFVLYFFGSLKIML